MIDWCTGIVACARLNGTLFWPSVASLMKSQSRSLYLLPVLIVSNQPPEPVAGWQLAQSGRGPLPILFLNAAIDFTLLSSPKPLPDCETRMPYLPDSSDCSVLPESCVMTSLGVTLYLLTRST